MSFCFLSRMRRHMVWCPLFSLSCQLALELLSLVHNNKSSVQDIMVVIGKYDFNSEGVCYVNMVLLQC